MTDKPKSLYTHDGSFIEGTRKASTIQELVDLLNEYPRNLPLSSPVYLTQVNIGRQIMMSAESLVIEDEDSWGLDDDYADDEDEETSE